MTADEIKQAIAEMAREAASAHNAPVHVFITSGGVGQEEALLHLQALRWDLGLHEIPPRETIQRFDEGKALECLIFLSQTGIRPDVLYKILWEAERAHMLTYGRTITGDDWVEMALVGTPLPLRMNRMLKQRQEGLEIRYYDMLHATREPNMTWFSESDLGCLNEALGTASQNKGGGGG